jgi:teichuronic acid exporter
VKNHVVSGAIWIGVGQAIRILTSLGTIFILARILSPADFGIIAIIIAVALGANQLGDFGLGTVAVQRPAISNDELSTIFWFNIIISCLLGSILFLCAKWLSLSLELPALVHPLQVSGFILPATSIRVAHRAILERSLEFKKIALADVIGTVSGALTAVTLAFLGAGVWALVFQQIMFAVGASCGYITLAKWLPSFHFSLRICREFTAVGWRLTASNLLALFSANINRPIISLWLGIEALGYYNFALQIVNYPMRNIAMVIQRMAFPILSRVQNENSRLRNIHFSIIHIIAFIMMPIVVVLVSLSDQIVSILFGEKWKPIVSVLYIIAFISIIRVFRGALNSALIAVAREKILLNIEVLGTILNLTAFLVGAQYGLAELAMCHLVSVTVTFFITLFYANRCLKHRSMELFRLILPVFASCILMYLSLYILIGYFDMTKIYSLVLIIVAGGLIYLVAEIAIDRKRLVFLLSVVWSLRSGARKSYKSS